MGKECCPTCGRPLYQVHSDRKLSDEDAAYIILNPDGKSNNRSPRSSASTPLS